MENHFADQTITLSMNINCCEDCPKILKKKLLKMHGVESVAIDTENNLVFVTGTMNPPTLLNDVAKLGKPVQILPADQHPNNHVKEKHKFNRNNEDRDNKGKMHKNCCCQDGRHNQDKVVEEKEEHKCEAYVPLNVDERECRDFYCKVHAKNKIVDRVPPERSTLFGMGGLPFYGGFGPYGGGSYAYPGWYAEEPPQFVYGRQPRMHPQHRFVFR